MHCVAVYAKPFRCQHLWYLGYLFPKLCPSPLRLQSNPVSHGISCETQVDHRLVGAFCLPHGGEEGKAMPKLEKRSLVHSPHNGQLGAASACFPEDPY